jgi:hypothetical protein
LLSHRYKSLSFVSHSWPEILNGRGSSYEVSVTCVYFKQNVILVETRNVKCHEKVVLMHSDKRRGITKPIDAFLTCFKKALEMNTKEID